MSTNGCISLVLEGTPYQQGLTQGLKLKDRIRENIAVVKAMNAKVGNKLAYNKFVRDNYMFLSQQFPELTEEMQGIADGSDLLLEDVIELNIPAYFMIDRFAQECSMILARGKATTDGKTYVIKNRDMRAPVAQIMLKRVYPDQSVVSEITGIGTVTYPASGINSKGLGVTTTGFWSKKALPDLMSSGQSQIFLNIHFLLRNCATVDEALVVIKSMKVMNGLNVILADTEKACAVEITKQDIVVEWDDGSGVLYRTNHYVSKELALLNPEEAEYPSTFMRYKRIGTLLHQYDKHIRFQDLYRILSDHKNGINCLCRHPSGSVTAQTVSTTLFVIEDRELWTTLGNPCFALPHMDVR
jgi:predicted choloylglycine hydrolase